MWPFFFFGWKNNCFFLTAKFVLLFSAAKFFLPIDFYTGATPKYQILTKLSTTVSKTQYSVHTTYTCRYA